MPASNEVDPLSVIDGCIFARWRSAEDIRPYVASGWREYLAPPPGRPARSRLVPDRLVQHPEGEREAAIRHRAAGWNPFEPDLGRDILASPRLARVTLCPEQGMMAAACANPILGLELSRATNRWLFDQLDQVGDGRVSGAMVVPSHLPNEAAAEVKSVGRDQRIVAVAMGANGLGKPFGNPAYLPIYRAAADHRLPLMIHTGSDTSPDTLSHSTGGGVATTYGGRYALRAQSVMTHLISLVGMGVFETIPELQIIIVGAGVTWLPSFLWRFDNDYKAQGGIDAPWLKRAPSDYIRDHVKVTTYALSGGQLPAPQVRALQTVPGLEKIICYASGYPAWDADAAPTVVAALPAEWRRPIMHDNAGGIYRWPATAAKV